MMELVGGLRVEREKIHFHGSFLSLKGSSLSMCVQESMQEKLKSINKSHENAECTESEREMDL
jgi:hypothetical protein